MRRNAAFLFRSISIRRANGPWPPPPDHPRWRAHAASALEERLASPAITATERIRSLRMAMSSMGESGVLPPRQRKEAVRKEQYREQHRLLCEPAPPASLSRSCDRLSFADTSILRPRFFEAAMDPSQNPNSVNNPAVSAHSFSGSSDPYRPHSFTVRCPFRPAWPIPIRGTSLCTEKRPTKCFAHRSQSCWTGRAGLALRGFYSECNRGRIRDRAFRN